MSEQTCQQCKAMEGKPVAFRELDTTCFHCKKRVRRILDNHHTNAHLCSLKCETAYWLGILY